MIEVSHFNDGLFVRVFHFPDQQLQLHALVVFLLLHGIDRLSKFIFLDDLPFRFAGSVSAA